MRNACRDSEGDGRKIASILDADYKARANELVQRAKHNPDETVGLLLVYSAKLRERCEKPVEDPDYLNPNTISNMFKPIKKIFKMNGVRFEWERIESTFPESVTNNETRGYTRNEIDRILKFANPLESAVIHIASSSGMRRGGFDFTWECIRPVYLEKDSLVMEKYDDIRDSLCGMIVVYAGTNEQYFAMFTPEAWDAVKVYRMQ